MFEFWLSGLLECSFGAEFAILSFATLLSFGLMLQVMLLYVIVIYICVHHLILLINVLKSIFYIISNYRHINNKVVLIVYWLLFFLEKLKNVFQTFLNCYRIYFKFYYSRFQTNFQVSQIIWYIWDKFVMQNSEESATKESVKLLRSKSGLH